MISETVTAALNKQVNEEYFSFYQYAAMAAYLENINLKGFANWMRVQSDEELMHAKKIANFILDRGGKVDYTSIAEPKTDWATPLDAITAAYHHECHISKCINELSTLAVQEKDHATHNFLEWFVAEQVEEEASVDEVVQQLKMIEGSPGALYMMDRELQKRSLEPAPEGV